jgi:hypothetical protein
MKGPSGAAVSGASSSSSDGVTEADVRQILMRHGKLTTKQLTQKLGDKLKFLSNEGKAEFRDLVRRLCTFKKEGDEKVLVLKDSKS